jgi:flagellar biosynthesis regulator FlaF
MEDKALVKIAEALVHLKDAESYIAINKNDFKNAPSLEGYYVDFSNIFNIKLFLILNNNKNFNIEKNTKEIEKNYFIVLNLYELDKSLEEFLNNLDKHSKLLIDLFEKLIGEFNIKLEPEDDETSKQYNLPYGYTRNKQGNIIVHKEEADLVRKIYMMYAKQKSMKKVAQSMKATGFMSRKGERIEFGVVSDILHDSRYLSKELPSSIVPISLFKKIQDILKRNVKEGRFIKYY